MAELSLHHLFPRTSRHEPLSFLDQTQIEDQSASKSRPSYIASAQSQVPANGQITGDLTITGTSGVNVIGVASLTLTGNLTLAAPAGAWFVINDSGNFNLHTGEISVGVAATSG